MELALKEVEKRELEPSVIGYLYSIIVGVIGTVFMVISVFSITAAIPLYIPCIIFVGIIGWILPYFVYVKVKDNKVKENTTLIEEQYNTIYDSCELVKSLIS